MADELDLARSVVKLRTALERYMVGMEQRAMQDPDPIALVHTADVAKDVRLILGGFEPGFMWPRTWSLPAEPGPEVTAVTADRPLYGFTRYERTENGWELTRPDGERLTVFPSWLRLLETVGPLTDASSTTDNGSDHAQHP